MSCNRTKSGFRVAIESLRGKTKTEAFAFFQPILGKPKYLYEDDGVVEDFFYEGEYQPNEEFSYDEYPSKDDGWFVDKVICEADEGEGDTGFYFKADQIANTIKELMEKFGVQESDITIFSYNYYTGADEPRLMQAPIINRTK